MGSWVSSENFLPRRHEGNHRFHRLTLHFDLPRRHEGNHRFHRLTQILWVELPAKGTEETEKKRAEGHKSIRIEGGGDFCC